MNITQNQRDKEENNFGSCFPLVSTINLEENYKEAFLKLFITI
jgi:hypothetical protein